MTIAPSGIERWEEGDTQPQTKFNILATSHNLWVSGKVLSRTTDAQPGSPAEGDAYIITATPSGAAWAGFTEDYVAQYLDGAWLEYAPIGAVRVYVADEAVDVRWSGSAWAVGTAANEFADNLFRIQDNADPTKELAFEVSGIATGTVRTITMPDADVTLGSLEGTAVKSTGEVGGTKFLREDGDGTSSWQTVAAGDADAIHDNVSGEIAALTEKVTPVSADMLIIEDSADTNAKKKVQVGNLPGGASAAVGARVARTTSQTGVLDSTDTTITWESEVQDDASFVDLGTNNDRITVSESGWYLVSAFVRWDSDATSARELKIDLNSAGTFVNGMSVSTGAYAVNFVSVPIYLSASDYVRAIVKQYSGGNRVIDVTYNPPFMSLVKL